MLKLLQQVQGLAAVAAHQASLDNDDAAAEDTIPAKRPRTGRASPAGSAWPAAAFGPEDIPLRPRMFSEAPSRLSKLIDSVPEEEGGVPAFFSGLCGCGRRAQYWQGPKQA